MFLLLALLLLLFLLLLLIIIIMIMIIIFIITIIKIENPLFFVYNIIVHKDMMSINTYKFKIIN